MDGRLAGIAALVVGLALAAVGSLEYLLPGFPPPPPDPFATGVFVVGAGLALLGAGGVAARTGLDHLAIRLGTGVGVVTLALAVLTPTSLRFGGVFWLGLLFAAFIGAAAARTGVRARDARG
jgi:hypothetical protein